MRADRLDGDEDARSTRTVLQRAIECLRTSTTLASTR